MNRPKIKKKKGEKKAKGRSKKNPSGSHPKQEK